MPDARSVAKAQAEETVRASYGRLLAWLSSRTKDVAMAEDALADAFQSALEHWPNTGVPDKPEAWLLTTARRKLIDQSRRMTTQVNALPDLAIIAEEAEETANRETVFPDERLKLLFICAHPAIDPTIRTPLMLQTVLGLDAARIASAFLVSPAAMSGRLVRAKRKIKTANISFAPPEAGDMPARLPPVLDAIYAAFGTGWDNIDGSDPMSADLTREAIFLGRVLCDLLPDEAEGLGLLSLMLHAQARSAARRANAEDANGANDYISLDEQDVALWDKQMIAEAEETLAHAYSKGTPGRYQFEAAIQSAHAARKLYNKDTANDIALLYEKLVRLTPSTGACVGYAAALDKAGESLRALEVLEMIDPEIAKKYQPYWAVKAHILTATRADAARDCYDRAIGLTSDDAIRRFLLGRRAATLKKTDEKN